MKHNEAFKSLVESILPHITEITVEQYQSNQQYTLIDVREDHEWSVHHLPQAKHLGKGIIERDIETHFPDRQTPLALYCGGGYRSAMAAYNLQLMGYTHVVSLAGGFKAWVDLQLPLAKG
ncbi:rhodanese-like domain-containing protein [Shewanella youngdeokensis]|uniref:Rhodanese-like domain-containing protein n=1 Tax=Shewanella youngdeokensis TaxID=2999068 RepID=A0ABZ0K1G8_9GAMM|nr:rhodanese-like domain-containing protein [Shewanella sp. DAU334]